VLRDSVCWARESPEETTDANGILVVAADNAEGTGYLRNDTAIATDAGGHGLLGLASNGAVLTVDVGSLIALSIESSDVAAELALAGNPEAKLQITHSD